MNILRFQKRSSQQFIRGTDGLTQAKLREYVKQALKHHSDAFTRVTPKQYTNGYALKRSFTLHS